MECMKLSVSDIKNAIDVVNSDLAEVRDGNYAREQIQDKKIFLDNLINKAETELKTLQDVLKSTTPADRQSEVSNYIESIHCPMDALEKYVSDYQCLLDKLRDIQTEYVNILEKCKNFNKKLCFSNIRKLLSENANVKIGQIEKAAGVRVGYMSRLEKEDNLSEPAIEFVVTAARYFNVSLDLLISIDLSVLTESDRYVLNVLDKLKLDTINNKLKWDLETANALNDLEQIDINEKVISVLFVDDVTENDGEITRKFIFKSNTFGTYTVITDNCYGLRLKNGTYLWLMNVGSDIPFKDNKRVSAREIWICGNHESPQYLVSNADCAALSLAVNKLFDVVQSRIIRPRLTDDVINSLDAFMKDDFTDDPLFDFSNGDIPF